VTSVSAPDARGAAAADGELLGDGVGTVRRRSTRQGAAVAAALAGEVSGFRTAQRLYDVLRARGERVSLATVYRHLNAMVADGSVDLVQAPGGEAAFRLCGPSQSHRGHHHHLVCRRCGRSVEVAGAELDDWIDRASAVAGYTDTTHTVEVFGLCPDHSTPAPAC